MTERMIFAEARDLNVADAPDTDLERAWHACASQISYHHADDSGREWGLASAIVPRAKDIETAMRARGMNRPTGEYLMGGECRIDWQAAA